MQGSNLTNSQSLDEIWYERMLLVFRIYTPAAAIAGIGLNAYGLFLVARFHHRLNFVPQLVGIMLSSLAFSLVLLAYQAGAEFNLTFSKLFCQTSIYIMASTQHFPGMCLSAISIERYFTIFHGPLTTTAAKTSRYGNSSAVLLISILSFGFQIYTIIFSDTSHQSHSCFVNSSLIGANTARWLLLLSLLFLYFIPWITATFVNMLLVGRLYWLFRPENLGMCYRGSDRKASTFVGAAVAPLPTTDPDDSRHLAPQLQHRINRGKRRTLLSFVVMMMVDLSLHFPSCFLNIAVRYYPDMKPSGLALIALVASAHILWHLQFLLNPLSVLVPVFHRRSTRSQALRMFFRPFSLEGRSILSGYKRKNIKFVVQCPDDHSMMIPPLPLPIYNPRLGVPMESTESGSGSRML